MNGQNLARNGSPEVNSMASGEAAKPKDLPEPVSEFKYGFFLQFRKRCVNQTLNLPLAQA